MATHEIGHALGLLHSDVESAVIWPELATGQEKIPILDDDDINGIKALYSCK